MAVVIVKDRITHSALQALAQDTFVDMIKVVADARRDVLAFGGESHKDNEAALLVDGSASSDLWGFCLYLGRPFVEAFEFRSQINVCPQKGNASVQIQDPAVCEALILLVQRHTDWDK